MSVNPFLKCFDEILNQIQTDWQNQFPDADLSQGALSFIINACLASALWGIHKGVAWNADQIFPDTADSENLDRHGWTWQIERTYGETGAAYLARILARIRKPPAGGNENDYIQWALEVDNVAAAYGYPLAQGEGTVDLIILANETNTGAETPSNYADITGTNDAVTANKLKDTGTDFTEVKKGDVVKNTSTGAQTTAAADGVMNEILLTADIFTATPENYEIVSLTQQVWDYICPLQPVHVNPANLRILPPTIVTQNVTMTATGADADEAQIAADIEDYMSTLEPDQTLYRSQLMSIAIANGAEDVTITTPAANVVPSTHEMIRPGVISVS